MAQRPQLSLTAELEKLEQKITLTLQEIDHNFARAHRIVTGSILPVVERYAKESEAVWDGSKFWKQFFEASANVALQNYQEDDTVYNEEMQQDMTHTTQQTYRDDSTYPASSPGHYTAGEQTIDNFTRNQETHKPQAEGSDDGLLDDSIFNSLNLPTGGAIQSTPKKKILRGESAHWADIESPFEALTKELTSKSYGSPEHDFQQRHRFNTTTDSSTLPPPPTTPTTIRRPQHLDNETPESSPFRGPSHHATRTPGVNEDQILHRVLDKNWRLQATPLGKPAPSRYRFTAATPKQPPFSHKYDDDSSPMSSPPEPQLQTQIFTPRALRTPGAERFATATRGGGGTTTANRYMYDEDDSDDDLLMPPGYSPPKTMQFSLPPSKLLATPAREASRRIVHDILQTAGADGTMTTEGSSPPRGGRIDDDDDPF